MKKHGEPFFGNSLVAEALKEMAVLSSDRARGGDGRMPFEGGEPTEFREDAFLRVVTRTMQAQDIGGLAGGSVYAENSIFGKVQQPDV
jgi:hypothetical protein